MNPLPENKMMDWTKLKSIVDDNFHVVKMVQDFSNMAANIVGKGENAGYHW